MTIRPTTPEDTPSLVALAGGTGAFKPTDVGTLEEVLDHYHAEARAGEGHLCVTAEEDGTVLGFAYYAPAPMTDRTWHLWWIAVSKGTQRRGLGKKLLTHIEDDVKSHGGRLLLIETSSVPSYEATRQFYVRAGYEQHAVVHDYYADGDSLVIFRKQLSG